MTNPQYPLNTAEKLTALKYINEQKEAVELDLNFLAHQFNSVNYGVAFKGIDDKPSRFIEVEDSIVKEVIKLIEARLITRKDSLLEKANEIMKSE